jgi:hypothetical protein
VNRDRRRRWLAALAVAAGCAAPVGAGEPSPGPPPAEALPSPPEGALAAGPVTPGEEPMRPAAVDAAELAELAARGYKVGEVRLDLRQIFDPRREGERVWLFRMANRFHRVTRPQTVRRMLLFQPADPVSPAAIAESERVLRGSRIFYDARIVPVRIGDDSVDFEVQARDVWSLTGGVGLGRSGGVNTFRVEVEDTNLLGYGKDLQFRYQSSVDRDLGYVRYRDANLFGSRYRLDTEIARASDGHEKRLAIDRPFYSLDARWGAGVSGFIVSRVEPNYRLGKVAYKYGRYWEFGELWGGWSRGLRDGGTSRWLGGWTYDSNDFYRARRKGPVSIVPPDRTISWLWLGGEWIRDRYVVTRDLDKIQRSEDLNLGRQATFRFGRSFGELGATYSEWVMSGTFSDGVRWGERQLLFTSGTLWGRIRDSRATDTLVTGTARYFLNDFPNGRLLVSAQGAMAWDLDRDRQLLLGGENGLRGYPLRYQQGNRLALLTLEQRVYHDREYLHLFRFGAAAFFDVGRAWETNGPGRNGAVDGWLRDIGVGLRVSSTRSARGAMVHFDVAYPLDGPDDISKVQYLVSTTDTF